MVQNEGLQTYLLLGISKQGDKAAQKGRTACTENGLSAHKNVRNQIGKWDTGHRNIQRKMELEKSWKWGWIILLFKEGGILEN